MRIPNIIGYSITSITSITPYNHQPGVSNTTQLSETMILRSQHPGEEGPVLIGSHLRKINLPRLQTLMKWTTRMDGKLWSTSDHSSKFSQTNSHQKKIWTASGFRIFFSSLSEELSVELMVVNVCLALLGLEFIPKSKQRKFTCHAVSSEGWYWYVNDC